MSKGASLFFHFLISQVSKNNIQTDTLIQYLFCINPIFVSGIIKHGSCLLLESEPKWIGTKSEPNPNLRNCVHGFRIGKVKKKQFFKENKVVLFFYIFIWIFRRGRLWWCLMSNGSSTKHERWGRWGKWVFDI